MKNYIDLHMHSGYSDDGEYTAEELVTKCHQSGIRIMAITDHNTVSVIDEELALCREMGIIAIPGVEIDCTWKGIDLHVVGYGIDHHQRDFQKIEEDITAQEIINSRKRVWLTNQMGFQLSEQDMEESSLSDVWPGELFAEVLLGRPEYADHELLKPYRPGGSRSDNPLVNFYWDFYSQGKPCYTETRFPDLETVIDLVHAHGGVLVLAHPGVNLKEHFEKFDELAAVGIDGVEAFSSYHDTETCEYFYEKAKQYDLLVTCGSDYHGKTKPAISLGGSGCSVNQQQIEAQLRQYGLI